MNMYLPPKKILTIFNPVMYYYKPSNNNISIRYIESSNLKLINLKQNKKL